MIQLVGAVLRSMWTSKAAHIVGQLNSRNEYSIISEFRKNKLNTEKYIHKKNWLWSFNNRVAVSLTYHKKTAVRAKVEMIKLYELNVGFFVEIKVLMFFVLFFSYAVKLRYFFPLRDTYVLHEVNMLQGSGNGALCFNSDRHMIGRISFSIRSSAIAADLLLSLCAIKVPHKREKQ